jgi:uracil-DNA glycosylase
MRDILDLGIYITTALKTPKEGYTPDPEVIKIQLPLLEAEFALFPNLKVIMLMGDVAIKMVNMITKAKTKKNVCQPGAAGRRKHIYPPIFVIASVKFPIHASAFLFAG